MYFINTKIVKSIANEIYREAGFTVDENNGWYVVFDSENEKFDFTVVFAVNRVMPDEAEEFKHFLITFREIKDNQIISNVYSTTTTLNRRELADKLLDSITNYEKFKEVCA